MIHLSHRNKSQQFEHLERVKNGIKNQVLRFGEAGFPEVFYPWSAGTIEALDHMGGAVLKEITILWRDSAIAEWVEGTPGLGPATYFVLGLLPPLEEFGNPAKVWRYCGLHPEGGRRRERGVNDGFNRRLKAYCVQRLAVPCEKLRASPYRSLYDRRKLATGETHPTGPEELCEFCARAAKRTAEHLADRDYTRERTAASFDCAAVGGPHWSAGHRRADALRVVAKAILLDAWRVTHGLVPRLGLMPVANQGAPVGPGATSEPSPMRDLPPLATESTNSG